MGNAPKMNGRVVRERSEQMDLDLAQAKMLMLRAMGQMVAPLGSPDPLTYHQSMKTAMLTIKDALAVIESAHIANREVVDICDRAAIRGQYRSKQ